MFDHKRIITLKIFLFFFVFAILLTGCDRQPEHKRVNVIFRLDDYSAKSSTDMELKILDTFRKNEASVTFAVIPFISVVYVHDPSPNQGVVPLPPKKGEILKAGLKDGILDIALHGYSHQTINTIRMTEFSGLAYDSQVERLVKGKEFLENMIDAPVTTFVPPWNRYDLNTLRALEELGFLTISANTAGNVTKRSRLNFLPASCRLSDIRNAVQTARTSSDNQPVIVVLFHHYDFIEIDKKRGSITLMEFNELLNWLKSQRDIRLLSIGQATKVIKDLSANRFLQSNWNYRLNRLLPSSLSGNQSFLYPESLQETLFLKVGGFYLMIVILGAVLSFCIGYFVFPRFTLIMKISIYGSILASIIIIFYVVHDLKVFSKGIIVSAGIVGAVIGLCICFLYLKKKNCF